MTGVRCAAIDFETYSEAGFVQTADGWACPPGASKKGLPVVGSSVYVEHPTFRPLCLSYDLQDGSGLQRWIPGNPPPGPLCRHIQAGGLISGWNSGGFETKVWAWCVSNLGWPAIHPDQWRDTMAASRAYALPGALAKAAEVLGTSEQKDKEGKRLLDKFSIPRNPTKKDPRWRITPEDDPEDFARLQEYCDQDVRTELSIGAQIPSLSDSELAVWQLDRRINDRGVQIDLEGVNDCIAIIEQAHALYNAELLQLTNGAVTKASEIQKLTGFIAAFGVHTDSLDEEHLTALLARPELPPVVHRVLEIRAAIGSASVKKTYAMRNQVSADGRLRDLFNYHGARTGRCIAEGSMVRVRGINGDIRDIPIEQLLPQDEVWDGQEWVSHGGLVKQGVQEVITYDGITATPNHFVYTSTNEYARLSELPKKGISIFRGEFPCPTVSID